MSRRQRLKLNVLSGMTIGLLASAYGGVSSPTGLTIILVGSFIGATAIHVIGDYMEVNK